MCIVNQLTQRTSTCTFSQPTHPTSKCTFNQLTHPTSTSIFNQLTQRTSTCTCNQLTQPTNMCTLNQPTQPTTTCTFNPPAHPKNMCTATQPACECSWGSRTCLYNPFETHPIVTPLIASPRLCFALIAVVTLEVSPSHRDTVQVRSAKPQPARREVFSSCSNLQDP